MQMTEGLIVNEKPFKSRWTLGMKVVSTVVVGTFLFRDLVWAADPSSFLQREKDKESQFLPRYLLEQQMKHEDFIQQKEDISNLTQSLNNLRQSVFRDNTGIVFQ